MDQYCSFVYRLFSTSHDHLPNFSNIVWIPDYLLEDIEEFEFPKYDDGYYSKEENAENMITLSYTKLNTPTHSEENKHYQKGELLGRGKFGEVYKGFRYGRVYAIK